MQPPFTGAVLLETHAHTAEISMCSELSAAQLVRLVAEHGYGAVVITDHFLAGQTETLAQRNAFARGYRLALAAGEAWGIAVLPGMELRFAGEGVEDYLVFLPDPELMVSLPGLTAMTPSSFRDLADAQGMLVYQAHPFRPGQRAASPKALHGVEVHNGNPNHNSANARALAYAQRHGLAMLSGSDLHEARGVRRGGIWVPREALTPSTFVAYLRAHPSPHLFLPE